MPRVIKNNVAYYYGINYFSDTLFKAPTCGCCGHRQAMYNGSFSAD